MDDKRDNLNVDNKWLYVAEKAAVIAMMKYFHACSYFCFV